VVAKGGTADDDDGEEAEEPKLLGLFINPATFPFNGKLVIIRAGVHILIKIYKL